LHGFIALKKNNLCALDIFSYVFKNMVWPMMEAGK
jgi:hypothetical protein